MYLPSKSVSFPILVPLITTLTSGNSPEFSETVSEIFLKKYESSVLDVNCLKKNTACKGSVFNFYKLKSVFNYLLVFL